MLVLKKMRDLSSKSEGERTSSYRGRTERKKTEGRTYKKVDLQRRARF